MNAWALSAPDRRTSVLLAAILAVCVVTGVMHYAGVEPVAVFVAAALALAGLAWVIGLATEAVGARFGPALTGVLQTTLGNLPELFVVVFALSAGEVVVAQTSILGSLFANALLVLGLAIVAGSVVARDGGGVMRFARQAPERHGDPAPARDLHHRPARPVEHRGRPGERACRGDLGGRRRLPPRRLRRLALELPAERREGAGSRGGQPRAVHVRDRDRRARRSQASALRSSRNGSSTRSTLPSMRLGSRRRSPGSSSSGSPAMRSRTSSGSHSRPRGNPISPSR